MGTRLRIALGVMSWSEAAVVVRGRMEWRNIGPIISTGSCKKVIPSLDVLLVHRKALCMIKSNKASSRQQQQSNFAFPITELDQRIVFSDMDDT